MVSWLMNLIERANFHTENSYLYSYVYVNAYKYMYVLYKK